MSAFQRTRRDGRTNTEVLIALLDGVQPGETVTYETLAAGLSDGSPREWTRVAVQQAVSAASRAILRRMARTLYPIRGVGYRLSVGADHHGLALRREARASSQMRQALDVLKHVQSTEMTTEQRTVHEAHLTITGALYQQVRLVTHRQRKQEDAIASLLARVDRLEQSAE